MQDENKPFLVETREGFSVKYCNKFLYSKYAPKKSILQIVQNLNILSDTLFLCISPLLCYGVKELISKLEPNCLLLGIEIDENLKNLTVQEYKNFSDQEKKIFQIPQYQELLQLPQNITKYGFFKRVITIDFSAGSQFNQDFYQELFVKTRDAVSQWWKNRITLVKFGRKYSTNLFKNLYKLSTFSTLPSISKPILLCGAGESALPVLRQIKKIQIDKRPCIICVDAELHQLLALNIKADFVVCEESQSIISRAFTGAQKKFDFLLCSVTSSPTVSRIKPDNTYFYTSLYSDTTFLSNLVHNEILPQPIPPLGSVGLVAMELALRMRANESVPIYLCGLDFSFSKGNTHGIETLHDKIRRTKNTKITCFSSFESCFNNDSIAFVNQNNQTKFTTPTLKSYAELFIYLFSKKNNVFSVTEQGYNLNLEINTVPECCAGDIKAAREQSFNKSKIIKWLNQEKQALSELRDIFTNKISLPETDRKEKISNLLFKREYLFLHFPDGYNPNLSQGFLNRVRIEIDYFLDLIQDSLEKISL